MGIQGAIFDMDGTLIDSLVVWEEIWSTLGARFFGNPDFRPSPEDDKKVRTMTLLDAMNMIHKNYSMASSGKEVYDCVMEVCDDFYENRVKLKDGVAEFLDYCKENGVKMCIASASPASAILTTVKRCGLEKYFDKIISCCDEGIGKGKDHPDVYFAAIEYLGTPVEETWVFEDSYVALLSAKKTGAKTAGIFDKYNYGQNILRENADEFIDDGENLMKLIGII